MAGSSTDVGLTAIPPSTLHEQDDLHEESSRVDLCNDTPLSVQQKPTSNFVAPTNGFKSTNDEGHAPACWRITGGLKIAKKNTEWYEALLVNDCKSLMKQLEDDGSLVVQTGYNGRTVLLAAARRGCTPLVDQVMDLFMDHEDHFITGKDHTKILQSPLHDLFQAKDFKTKLRAVEIMQHFMRNDVIRCHMESFYDKFSPFLLSVNSLTGYDIERMIAREGNQLEGGGQSGIPMASFKAHAKTHIRNNLASKNNTHLEHSNNDIDLLHGKTKSVPLTPAIGNEKHIDEKILANIRDITYRLLETKKFDALMGEYSEDKDYNFDKTRTELIFHYACQSMSRRSKAPGSKSVSFKTPGSKFVSPKTPGSAEEFLRSFMKELGEGEDQKILQGSHGDKILRSLYEIKNWQGKTPCHVALSGSTRGFEKLLGLLRDKNDTTTIGLFLNARDARGWTLLHKAVAMVSEHNCYMHRKFITFLLTNEMVNMNEKLPLSKATPLHLAILHDLPEVVHSLIQSPKNIEGVLNALLRRKIQYSNQPTRGTSYSWSPLQLATIMGHHVVVEALIKKIDMIYEVSKLKNKGVAPKNYEDKIPSIHLAAASGVPEVLQLFLNKKPKIFDSSKTTTQKRTTLHFAVDTTAPFMVDKPTYEVNKFMNPLHSILDFGDAQHLDYIITEASKKKLVVEGHVGKGSSKVVTQKCNKPQLTTLEEYGGKQACIAMLLQDGVDIWQRDDQWKFAEPGAKTSNEIRMWWFEKKTQETSATKKTINDASNAISVVAALIATASYVGPLSPPLGFGTASTSSYFDFVQTSSIPVQIFVISNCMSFYLAIGSIMFAIVPSVPLPKQGIKFDEWQRSKRTVGAALSLLLFSVFCVVVSFAAASNVGMSDYGSYKHVGLAFYPAMFGGISCLIGIVVFFMGFWRFIMSFGIGIKYDIKKFIRRHGKDIDKNHMFCEPSNRVKTTKDSQVGEEANDKENL